MLEWRLTATVAVNSKVKSETYHLPKLNIGTKFIADLDDERIDLQASFADNMISCLP